MPSSHLRTIHDESSADREAAAPPAVRGPESVWDRAHLGDLTGHLPAEMVDAALEATCTRERRTRLLPSRVVVYFVVALALLPELGCKATFTKLCLGAGVLATITASALVQARRRVGIAPLRWIFELLRGPAPTTGAGSRFGALRICSAMSRAWISCSTSPTVRERSTLPPSMAVGDQGIGRGWKQYVTMTRQRNGVPGD